MSGEHMGRVSRYKEGKDLLKDQRLASLLSWLLGLLTRNGKIEKERQERKRYRKAKDITKGEREHRKAQYQSFFEREECAIGFFLLCFGKGH